MDRYSGPTRKQEYLRYPGVDERCSLRFGNDSTRLPHSVLVGIECDVRSAGTGEHDACEP